MRLPRTRIGSVGYTMVEAIVAVSLFSVVGYALAIAVGAGSHSQRMVSGMAAEDRALRTATSQLLDELASTSLPTLTITQLADGNHCVRFKLPVDDAGADAWGVMEHGTAHIDWSVQYTVRSVNVNGAQERKLQREIVDDGGIIQATDVLVERVCSGTDDPPGFQMVQAGDLWEVTLSTLGRTEGKAGIREVFHVRIRN